MKRNKPKSSRVGGTLISAILVGVLAASLLSILLTGLLANFILNEHIGEEGVGAAVFVIRAVSLFSGALIGARVAQKEYLKLVSIIAAGYLFLLIGTGVVFFDGSFKHFLSGVVSILLGGATVLLILLKPKSNTRRRFKISL